jgi:hypothetical protein
VVQEIGIYVSHKVCILGIQSRFCLQTLLPSAPSPMNTELRRQYRLVHDGVVLAPHLSADRVAAYRDRVVLVGNVAARGLGECACLVAGTESVLAGTKSVLAGTESVLAGTESVLAGTESALTGTESVLARTESVLAGTETSSSEMWLRTNGKVRVARKR